MDDVLFLILGLVVMALIISGVVLPIVALVVSIRTRKRLNHAPHYDFEKELPALL